MLNEQSENIGSIPNYDFRIYKKEDTVRSDNGAAGNLAIVNELKSLKSEPSIEYATVAYRRDVNVPATQIDDLMFATQEFVVQFKPEVTKAQIDELNKAHQVVVVKALDYAQNGFVLLAPEAYGEKGPVVISNLYHESGLVKFAHPNFVQRKHTRAVAEKKKPVKTMAYAKSQTKVAATKRDDFLARQWHLETAKVKQAWDITRGSSNIKVAILDDGVDVTHPEFAGKIITQYDFATSVANGTPKTAADNHGTACAGVAVAKGVKSYGSAPGCSLIVANTPNFLGSVEEGDMFKWVCDQGADIISCSWGPRDGTGAVDPLPDNTRAAINYCVTNGRGGLGINVFWAAGNGDESVSNDGYASNPDIVAVAASSSNETRSWYSDYGPEVFICAPSSGDSSVGEMGIFTVDRQGNDGYNPDKKTGLKHPTDDINYTDSFGGTSSATPLAAGIAALMLSINPKLNTGDVRSILKDTADKIDNAGGNYDSDGHSNYYGYGRINACAAVIAARDVAGGGSSGNTGTDTDTDTEPGITTTDQISRTDGPPTFEIDKGGRNLYAVEVAIEAELFNSATRESDRNDDNFFGSWSVGLDETTPYTLPEEVWNKLNSADRLYYRVHVADDSGWSKYGISTADADYDSAPSFEIAGEITDGGNGDDSGTDDGDGGMSSDCSITAPASINSNDGPPAFDIGLGGRAMYAVETATEAALFNSETNEGNRDDSNFYASWSGGLLTALPFTMPSDAWEKLKCAGILYYRVHVADDSNWSNYSVSIADSDAENAPFIEITSTDRISKDAIGAKPVSGIKPFFLSDAKKEDEELWKK
jgi:subtilisin family serine protease